MKKLKLLKLLTAALVLTTLACNDDAGNTTTTDTSTTMETNTTVSEPVTNPSSTSHISDYAALADTFRRNSEAGNYLDLRSGKAIRIGVDPQTGIRYNLETEEPVWRYVDKRTWWVYGGDNWDRQGEAKMEGNKILYRDDDNWVTYDDRWKTDDEKMEKDWKTKNAGTKIKVSKDGDIKIKNEKGKVKYDADDKKMKVDTSR